MPFRESIKLFLDTNMTLFREKVKVIFSIRNIDTAVTPQVEPQHSANFGNTQSYDKGLSRQLPGHLIIGGSAQEKDLENVVTNPLNDNGITQYFDSALMAQLPHRFAIGGVGIQGIEQSDNQVTDAGVNEIIEPEANLPLDGADNQDIDTVETQVLGGDENGLLQNLEPTVSSDVGNYGFQALGCVRSSSYPGGSSWSPGQDVIEVRRLSYHPYQTVSRSLAADGESNYSLANSEDSFSDWPFNPSQNSEILGFREHSAPSVACIAVIAQHSTISVSNSLRSRNRVSIYSQRDPSSETTLLPQDSLTTMTNNTFSSFNTVNHVNSSEINVQDAGSDTVSSSSSTANSDKCDTPAKVKIDDCVSRAMRSSVEELRQHYLNGHLSSPEPYSSLRGNNLMEEFRRRENGETPIGYSGQVDTMDESAGEATVDATEERCT